MWVIDGEGFILEDGSKTRVSTSAKSLSTRSLIEKEFYLLGYRSKVSLYDCSTKSVKEPVNSCCSAPHGHASVRQGRGVRSLQHQKRGSASSRTIILPLLPLDGGFWSAATTWFTVVRMTSRGASQPIRSTGPRKDASQDNPSPQRGKKERQKRHFRPALPFS